MLSVGFVSVFPVVADAQGERTEGLTPAEADALPATEAEHEVLQVRQSVFFSGGSAYLHPEEIERLQHFLDAHEQLGAFTIELHGHTDDIGDRAYNLRLSAARIRSVVNYLLSYPVAADAIHALPLGEDAPSFDNATWEGKLSNRRVDVILVPLM